MKWPLSLVAILLAGSASAQEPGWEVAASLYGWLPGLDTSLNVDAGRIDSSKSGSDVLENLDAAFMGAIVATRGKWVVIGDLIYANLGSSEDTPFGALYSKAEVDLKMTAFSGYLAYRVYENAGASVDLGAGFRWFALDLDATLTAGSRPEVSSSTSSDWADPLIAARFVVPFNDKWFATGFFDAGGTFNGDSSTRQAFASVGYRFNERWSAQLGYRYMSLSKEIGGNDTTVDLYGPVVGVTARF